MDVVSRPPSPTDNSGTSAVSPGAHGHTLPSAHLSPRQPEGPAALDGVCFAVPCPPLALTVHILVSLNHTALLCLV